MATQSEEALARSLSAEDVAIAAKYTQTPDTQPLTLKGMWRARKAEALGIDNSTAAGNEN